MRYSRSGEFFVIVFYGIGGIGKTRLLRHLREITARHSDQSRAPIIHIDLEATHIVSPIDFLYEAYCRCGIHDAVFEYALMKVWAHAGRDLAEFRNRLVALDSPILELADMVLGWAAGLSPIAFVRRIGDAIQNSMAERFGETAVAIGEVANLDPLEVEERLPHLLGQAIARAIGEESKRPIFFLDSLDALAGKRQFANTKWTEEYWTSELIGTASAGLWFLASREKLRWAEANPAWGKVLDQHLIGALSPEDARRFLEAVPIHESDIIAQIIAVSRGVPIYLDLCVSIYVAKTANGELVDASTFDLTDHTIVDRYLSHLDTIHAEAIRVLSIFDEFDPVLFENGLRAWNIPLPLRIFTEIANSALALPIDGEGRRYRIHDIVRSHVAIGVTPEQRAAVVHQLVQWLDQETSSQPTEAAWIAARLAALFVSQSVPLSPPRASQLFCVLADVIEHGGASALLEPVEGATSFDSHTDIVADTMLALQALVYRRHGRLREAQGCWARVGETLVGTPASDRIQYFAAHTDHLLGAYDEAEITYIAVAGAPDSPPRSEAGWWARRQIADLQMLRGDFQEALRGFESMAARNPADGLWLAECCRHQGHVFRFNFDFERSQASYAEAERLATAHDLSHMLAKIRTNRAELLCFEQPLQAVAIASEAVDLNNAVGNLLEVGKALTAKSIAEMMLKNIERSLKLADEAEQIQQEVGYSSGVLFAKLARFYALYIADERERAQEELSAIELLARKLGVYAFLLALPEELLPSSTRAAKDVRWLSVKAARSEIGRRMRTMSSLRSA